MKYVVLSFDDGRKDFYTNAFPLLKKYGLPATLNIITDFLGRNDLDCFDSANHECMTKVEMMECANSGVEIACHSANHTNDIEQVKKGCKALIDLLGTMCVGFASPESEICVKNIDKYRPLIKDGTLSYIRSGNQIRRDGYFHAGLYFAYKYTHSKKLFRLYNSRNIIDLCSQRYFDFYPSVACNADNDMKQIVAFVSSLYDNSAVVIMFHSVLKESDPGYGKDRWYNSTNDFEKLCRFLTKQSDIKVVTNIDLHRIVAGDKNE